MTDRPPFLRSLSTWAENEALSKRNAELGRALAFSPRRVIPAHPTSARLMRAAGYRPLKSRTHYNPVTGLIAREYWARDEEKE